MPTYWMPRAVKKPLDRNFMNSERKVTNAVILHVALGESDSLHGWFNSPLVQASYRRESPGGTVAADNSCSSHFYVRRDGTIEQYIPINLVSCAEVQPDQRAISVQTQGMGYGTWTGEQIAAMQQIIRYCQSVYPGIPSHLMRSSKTSETGIGWHELGISATHEQKLRRVSQTGGELWSGAAGKACPGPDRIKQVPELVAGLAGTTTAAKKEDQLEIETNSILEEHMEEK